MAKQQPNWRCALGSTINIGDAVVAALRFCMMHPFALPCSRCVAFGCMSRSRCDVASFVCVVLCSHLQVVMFFVFRLTCLFAWWPPRGEGPSSGGHQANIKYNMERRTQGKQQQRPIARCSNVRCLGERACLTKYVFIICVRAQDIAEVAESAW